MRETCDRVADSLDEDASMVSGLIDRLRAIRRAREERRVRELSDEVERLREETGRQPRGDG